jgi:signal transduction histidine kinase
VKSAPTAEQQVLDALGRIGESDLQEIVDLVQHICGVESAAISILESGHYHLLVTTGMEPLVCDSEDALCTSTMDSHHTVVVEDAREDPRFQDSRYVDGTFMSLRFYASAPIYAPDGSMVGRLCVFDSQPRLLDPLQARTLTTLAGNVSKVLELRMREPEDPGAAGGTTATATSEDALRVAARISHDLRIPLTALTASLGMLEATPTTDADPVRARVLGSALRAAERMARMVDQLLLLNDAGRDLAVAEVDLAAMVAQVVADTEPLLRAAGASVDVGPMPRVQGDPDQLYSILLNLISNAAKFARPGVPPVIRLRSERLDLSWRIAVIDNGTGIPASRRDEVFSMFSRLDPAVGGNGIGLATVQRAVENHGGRVGIEDAPGHGVEIWFALPARAGS